MHRSLTYRPRPGRHRKVPRRVWPAAALLMVVNTLAACSIPLLTLKG